MRLLALLLLAGGLSAAPLPSWSLGQANARLLQAGYSRDEKHHAWEAEFELRFVNNDLQRRFHRNVLVDFVGPDGKAVTWKGFLNLAPGSAQHRRVRVPERLRCGTDLTACAPLKVRVFLTKPERAALVPIPAQALAEPQAPPAGKPLWVARVYDGDTLELMDGSKIRLLGIDTPEASGPGGKGGPQPGYQEATDFTRVRVMNAPIQLAYDGEPRDIFGRWLAQVTLEDGVDLNADLLRRGLAKVYLRSEADRLEDYKKIEAQARERGLGLWKSH